MASSTLRPAGARHLAGALRGCILGAALLMAAPVAVLADYDLGVSAREAGDVAVARAAFTAALAEGDARAAMALGEMAENGEGGYPSPEKACVYFRKAAEAGLAEGQYRAGECYRTGVLHGDSAAIDWFEKAADQGYAPAFCALGRMYMHGSGVITNREQGFARCLAGARAGDASAMDDVAEWYATGQGTELDRDEAWRWWRKAAEAGDQDAVWHLGLAYKNGNGVAPDPAQADRYLRRAFELGELRAAAMLAQLLVPLAVREDGSVDPRIGTAALFWSSLSVRIDESAEIRSRSKLLHDGLAASAPALVARAARMVEDWLGQHPGLDRGA